MKKIGNIKYNSIQKGDKNEKFRKEKDLFN